MTKRFGIFVVLAALITVPAMAVTWTTQDGNSEPIGGTHPPNVPAEPQGGTFYTDQAAWEADAGAVVCNTFPEIGAGVCSGASPATTTTADGCLNPGDIIPGWQFNTIGAGGTYAALATGFLGAPVPMLGPNTFTDSALFEFLPAAGAVGITCHGDLINPVNLTFEAFDGGGGSLGTQSISCSLAGNFVGVVAAAIGSVSTADNGGAGDMAELFSEVCFTDSGGDGGDGGDGGQVPASNGIGMMLMVLLLIGTSAYFLRRRATN